MLDFNHISTPVPYDLDELSRALAERAANWVPQLYPRGMIEPGGDRLRLANINGAPPNKHGSCVIDLKGQRAGCWADFGARSGSENKGGPLSTLAHATGLRGRELLAKAAEICDAKLVNGNTRTSAAPRDRSLAVASALQGAGPMTGTLAEIYFASRRLTPPVCTDLLFKADLTDYSTSRGRPAIIAKPCRPDTGEWTGGIHRTYLRDDGTAKADIEKPKMMLGPCDGGVVMLGQMTPDGRLGLAEGIETAIAVSQLFDNLPTWAALSAGNMRKFTPPTGLKKLLVFADRGKDGEAAATELYRRMTAGGIEVVAYLPHSDDDFNKDLMIGDCDQDGYHPWLPQGEPSIADAEIIQPAPCIEQIVTAARLLSANRDGTSIGDPTQVIRDLAVADADPIVTEQILAIIKRQTGLPIATLRTALKAYRREVGTESRAVANTDGIRRLQIGSDVEIAEQVADRLRDEHGELVFADGDFWRYNGTFWQVLDMPSLRRAVHKFDGAVYDTPAGNEAAVQLGKARIDSVLHEMGALLAQPNFFVEAPPGINCASGFIAFAADGKPTLRAHDPEHRCRHALPGRWHPDAIDPENPPPHSLLGRLLNGVFKGDADAHDKRKVIAETAGAAAVGYGPRLRQPKAVVLSGETAENGKSQILDAIRGLLPASAIASVSANKFGDERHIVGLRGKLLNATDELSANAISSDVFKAVVTGNPVSGRDVYRSAIEFRPAAQNVFAVNRLPTFTGGMDRGVERRLLPVIFNRVIPLEERIEDIGQRIGQEEPDLLLAFAVAGAERLIRQRGFTIPPSSKEALQQWLYRDNPVIAWVQARVDPARMPQPGEKPIIGIKSAFVYLQFRQWALEAGFAERYLPDVSGFVQRLKENKIVSGIKSKHTRSGNWLTGLEIRTTDRSPDHDGSIS